MKIPEKITQYQLIEALSVLGLDASHVKSLSVNATSRNVHVEFGDLPGFPSVLFGYAEIPVSREPCDGCGSIAPEPHLKDCTAFAAVGTTAPKEI